MNQTTNRPDRNDITGTMKISLIDASNYFKGLLLLIKKDRNISDPERENLKRIGKALGFEKSFCENAIHEILDNPHIVDTPPEFSTREIAMKFIKDGFRLASSDKDLHALEEEWLRMTAEKNKVDNVWFRKEIENLTSSLTSPSTFEVEQLSLN